MSYSRDSHSLISPTVKASSLVFIEDHGYTSKGEPSLGRTLHEQWSCQGRGGGGSTLSQIPPTHTHTQLARNLVQQQLVTDRMTNRKHQLIHHSEDCVRHKNRTTYPVLEARPTAFMGVRRNGQTLAAKCSLEANK